MENNSPEQQAAGSAAEPGEDSTRQGGRGAPDIVSVEALIAHLAVQMHVSQGQQIVHIEPIAARQAEYATPTPSLAAPLQHALEFMGIERLYTHQVEALERVRQGENIVVVTATSSGKTLCYNLPVIERVLADRDARAIYIYPINALVNDQLKSLFRINLALGKEAVGVARYTGALSSDKRKAARARNPHIWLTNPEMLHLSFLLWHANWEELWRNLRFIVIDEVHSYRGVFGSNMAHLFRRMLRVAAYYGSKPQFICCSATIANPRELAETLTGEKFAVVDHDGAGIGRKFFVLWNPPLQSDDGSNVRRSYAEESVDLLLHCVRAHYNAIVFARARRLTERMLRMSRALSEERGESQLLEHISSYRAGYLAEEREDIEGKLKAGDIQGIITTNALEMGIDIGGLDAAIISGYPGTMMSTWQQAGRAGRRGREALVVLVASQNPLDQYYVHHPSEFFARPHELAVVDLDNQYIRLKHVLCSARELPFSPTELAHMLPEPRSLIEEMRQAGLLVPHKREDDAEELTYPQGRLDVHFRVSLRAASQETYHILDDKRNEIGTIELPNVFRETHPGAIYQHGGDDYRVTFLDRQRKIVHVREEHSPHYTRPSSTQALEVSQVYASQGMELGGIPFQVSLGAVLVEETIRSYQELRLEGDELVRKVNLEYPLIIRLHTTAMWLTIPPTMEAQVQAAMPPVEQKKTATGDGEVLRAPLVEGLHAVQHLVTGMMPLMVMCDQRDVDGFYHVQHPDLQAPAVFVYDAYEGGIGLAEVAYQRVAELLRLAHDTVARCQCLAGCPSCIQSGACRLRNDALNKVAAITILAELTGRARDSVQPISDPDAAVAWTVSPAIGMGLTERAASSRQRALEDLLEHTRRKGIEEAAAIEKPVVECKFAKGDWVEQSPYGRGQVLESRIEGQRELVQVRFLRGTVKEVDASKGSLRKGKA